MGPLGIPEILVILVIVAVIFGAGKLPKVMGDLGKGIRNFKDGVKGQSDEAPAQPAEGAARSAVVDNTVATPPASPISKGEETSKL